MKKSRITKLALSGAAVAALAATFSTSTYAWYVSNKTANTEAVLGSTATSGAGSSISLSLTGNMNDFHKSIALPDKTTGLQPVLRTGATISDSTGSTSANYYELDETASPVVAKGTASNTEGTTYYEYKFYIKADTQCTVRPTITVVNTSQTLPTQINYSGGYQKITDASAPTFAANTFYSYSAGTYTAVSTQPDDWNDVYKNYYRAIPNAITGPVSGADFYADAIDALHMSLGMEKGTKFVDGTTEAYVRSQYVGEYAHDVSTVTNYLTVTKSTNTPSGATLATAGAHNYYEAITQTTLDSTAKTLYTTGKTSFGDFTNLAADTPYLLVYHLWLDGADDQCFNCCAGQTFSVQFDFTVTA